MNDQGSIPGRDVSLRHNIQTDSEALSVNKANVYRSDGFRMESYFHSAIHLVLWCFVTGDRKVSHCIGNG